MSGKEIASRRVAREGRHSRPGFEASRAGRLTAQVLAVFIAVVFGSAGAVILSLAVGLVAGVFLDAGSPPYEEGEMNYGLGMLMVFIAFLAFLVLAPLLSFFGWRALVKRLGSSRRHAGQW
jgi:hypothetical protein